MARTNTWRRAARIGARIGGGVIGAFVGGPAGATLGYSLGSAAVDPWTQDKEITMNKTSIADVNPYLESTTAGKKLSRISTQKYSQKDPTGNLWNTGLMVSDAVNTVASLGISAGIGGGSKVASTGAKVAADAATKTGEIASNPVLTETASHWHAFGSAANAGLAAPATQVTAIVPNAAAPVLSGTASEVMKATAPAVVTPTQTTNTWKNLFNKAEDKLKSSVTDGTLTKAISKLSTTGAESVLPKEETKTTALETPASTDLAKATTDNKSILSNMFTSQMSGSLPSEQQYNANALAADGLGRYQSSLFDNPLSGQIDISKTGLMNSTMGWKNPSMLNNKNNVYSSVNF